MPKRRFISYLRVSTARQGKSGLGLEAQRAAVLSYLNGGSWELLSEYVECESGKRSDRPQLAAALAACRIHNAVLLIAKLDRLSRDAAFLLGLQNAGVRFIAVDMPEANELVVGIMAVVAQAERKMISDRTKAALAAAKARGMQLGGFRGRAGTAEDCKRARIARITVADRRASDLAPTVRTLQAQGRTSFNAIAGGLNALGIPTPRGGSWGHSQVRDLLGRIEGLENRG
ncbi:recombinase family protein [Microvirga sesbaniae]|uniref:recombinase family protein n=1 Tax=Microvirga sesbaniae TaxID=681392 RepID=UPI0021C68519|nr:recombinase family protein [Microvirga sp. HBU67692]